MSRRYPFLPASGFRLERENTMTCAVLIELGPTSVGATVPDLPGCFAVGRTREEVDIAVRNRQRSIAPRQ